MTKHKGQVASFAPSLGQLGRHVAAVALGAALISSGGSATAGSCVASGPAGNFVCSNPANPTTDAPVEIFSGGAVSLTTEAGFGLNVNAVFNGSAINLRGDGVNFTDGFASMITTAASAGNGLEAFVDIPLSGDIVISSNGTISGSDLSDVSTHRTELGV